MAGGVAVAVVLLLCLGGDHGFTLAQNCNLPDADLVTEGNKKTVFTEESGKKSKSVLSTLYVRPGSDFKGISLDVTQKNGHVVAWFAVDKCYKKGTKWLPLGVDVKSVHIKDTLPELQFNLNIGNCKEECKVSNVRFYIHSLSVVAHGSSNWIKNQPAKSCLAASVSGTKQNLAPLGVCTKPPSPNTTTSTATTGTSTTTPTATTATTNPPGSLITTPTTTNATANLPGTATIIPNPTQTTTVMWTPSPTPTQRGVTQAFSSTVIIMVPAVMVTAIVVTVVACVVNRRRRRRLQEAPLIWRREQSDPVTPTRDSIQVRENSLYESFSGPPTLATREQHDTVVRENSLYESFSGPLNPTATREEQEPVSVSENSLYEPFSGPPTLATREQHETVVMENSLYESFSGP